VDKSTNKARSLTIETAIRESVSPHHRVSLIPARRFSEGQPELMDAPHPDPTVLREDLRNLRIINRLFGGLRAVRIHAQRLLGSIEEDHTVEVLDLATGSADHPIALARLARRLGRRIHITAVDRNPVTLSIARERTKTFPEITVEEGNLLALQYPAKSFDIVLCSLALHHFSRTNGVRILKTMVSLSRTGLIINDLSRSWPAAWAAWTYAHLTTRNPMTLNDSYVSVLRAFTPSELLEIAREADAPNLRMYRHPMFRLVLVGGH
jgi:ubiquinone/menaquinone biosynthesis C-methylase UbiE